jgi:cyclase
MRRLSKSIYAEFYLCGCNPGFVVSGDGVMLVDTPQQPIDALRWREMITDRFGPIRCLVNTEAHWDHIHGNAYFPGIEVIGQEGINERYEPEILERVPFLDRMKQTDPDSYWLCQHPSFPLNPPTRIFTDRFELSLGEHQILLKNCPGHTQSQTHVYVMEEKVVFVGDNIFHQCKTWFQECDPWKWLESLGELEEADLLIVPGHGEPCRNDYIAEQKAIIQGWLDVIEEFIRRGLTEEEAVKQPFPPIDPYPLGQRLDHWKSWVHEQSTRHLYRLIANRLGMGTVSTVPIRRSL